MSQTEQSASGRCYHCGALAGTFPTRVLRCKKCHRRRAWVHPWLCDCGGQLEAVEVDRPTEFSRVVKGMVVG